MKPIGLIARRFLWRKEGTWFASRGREKAYARRRFTKPEEAEMDAWDEAERYCMCPMCSYSEPESEPQENVLLVAPLGEHGYLPRLNGC